MSKKTKDFTPHPTPLPSEERVEVRDNNISAISHFLILQWIKLFVIIIETSI